VGWGSEGGSVHGGGGGACIGPVRPREELVNDLVDGGLLVPGARHDVLVVCRNVTAQDRGRLLGLQKNKRNIIKL